MSSCLFPKLVLKGRWGTSKIILLDTLEVGDMAEHLLMTLGRPPIGARIFAGVERPREISVRARCFCKRAPTSLIWVVLRGTLALGAHEKSARGDVVLRNLMVFFLLRCPVRDLFAQLEELKVDNLLVNSLLFILENFLARVGVHVDLEHTVARVTEINL